VVLNVYSLEGLDLWATPLEWGFIRVDFVVSCPSETSDPFAPFVFPFVMSRCR
jgi:hypothetical protein